MKLRNWFDSDVDPVVAESDGARYVVVVLGSYP